MKPCDGRRASPRGRVEKAYNCGSRLSTILESVRSCGLFGKPLWGTRIGAGDDPEWEHEGIRLPIVFSASRSLRHPPWESGTVGACGVGARFFWWVSWGRARPKSEAGSPP